MADILFDQPSTATEIGCLICERVDPSCGWEQPLLLAEMDGKPWSVCQDCVARRAMGQD